MSEELSNGRPVAPDIRRRSYEFALRIVRLCRELSRERVGRMLVGQVLRSGTAIGANIEEAQAAQSKPDFVAKMSIARKEAFEVHYWLRLLRDAEMLAPDRMEEIIGEADEIARVLSSIVLSAKQHGDGSGGRSIHHS